MSGVQAACELNFKSGAYVFVPGSIASPAADAGHVGLAEVKVSDGSGILANAIVRAHSHRAKLARDTRVPGPRGVLSSAALHRLDKGAGGSTIIPLMPAPQECAADVTNSDLYLINYDSPTVSVVHVDPTTQVMSLLRTFNTDASDVLNFSGGSGVMVGETWDPVDNGLIVATGKGYELYNGARSGSPGTKNRTIASVIPSENFGYNSSTNQIWSPTYLTDMTTGVTARSFNLVDVKSGADLSLQNLPDFFANPDNGAVDATTNLAVVSDEAENVMYLYPLSQNVTSGSTFSNPAGTTVAITTDSNFDLVGSDLSIDSGSHLMFTVEEFGTHIGVITLPSSGAGTPALGPYVFAEIPSIPGGDPPQAPGDPHAIATFNLAGSGPYGITFDDKYETVVVLDMRAMLAAPEIPGDTNTTTLTLGKNIYYFTI